MLTRSEDPIGRIKNRLRPMGVADLLDETVEFYRNNFGLLIRISLLLWSPYYLLQKFAKLEHLKGMSFITGLGVFIIEPIASGAFTLAVMERRLGKSSSIWMCCKGALRPNVFWRLLCAEFVVWVIVVGVTAAAMIPLGIIGAVIAFAAGGGSPVAPGIGGAIGAVIALLAMAPVWARYLVVTPVIMMEGKRSVDALRRSWALTSGYASKGFWLLIIAMVILMAAPQPAFVMVKLANRLMSGPGVPLTLTMQRINTILSVAATTLTAPAMAIVKVYYYYDLRVRKEGFDLELLAAELGGRDGQSNVQEAATLPQEQLGALGGSED